VGNVDEEATFRWQVHMLFLTHLGVRAHALLFPIELTPTQPIYWACMRTNRNFMGVSLDILEGKRPEVPSDCPEPYHKMMTHCWHAKPERRPSISDVLELLTKLVGSASFDIAPAIV